MKTGAGCKTDAEAFHFHNCRQPYNLRMAEAQWAYICAMKMLMVCLGNICRSPLAEGIMKKKAEDAGLEWFVDSAGTNGFHIGEAPHPLSQKVALQHGIDISGQRARQFLKEDIQRFDHIYLMAKEVMYELEDICGDLLPSEKISYLMDARYPGEEKDIPDPWYGPEPGYHEVFTMIEEACDAIIKQQLDKQRKSLQNQ